MLNIIFIEIKTSHKVSHCSVKWSHIYISDGIVEPYFLPSFKMFLLPYLIILTVVVNNLIECSLFVTPVILIGSWDETAGQSWSVVCTAEDFTFHRNL